MTTGQQIVAVADKSTRLSRRLCSLTKAVTVSSVLETSSHQLRSFQWRWFKRQFERLIEYSYIILKASACPGLT